MDPKRVRKALPWVALAGAAACYGHGSAHWGYGTRDCPAVWAELSPAYALCGTGPEQSPIDLRDAEVVDHAPMLHDYEPSSLQIIRHEHVVDVVDNGHTIQVDYDDGSTLQVGADRYELAQFHFHAPSEHTIDGRRFPMEMHLVHRSASGGFAVLGVLIEEGAHHPAFDPFWGRLPQRPGERLHLEHVQVDIDDLLPESQATYRYRGSLTTPPCSEGVRWFVAVEPIALSAAQIDAFTSIIHGNARPVQPLGPRAVTMDRVRAEIYRSFIERNGTDVPVLGK